MKILMKLTGIFVLFALSVNVNGAWFAAAVQPVLLSLGAVLGVLNLDELDIQPIEWRNFMDLKKIPEGDTPY